MLPAATLRMNHQNPDPMNTPVTNKKAAAKCALGSLMPKALNIAANAMIVMGLVKVKKKVDPKAAIGLVLLIFPSL